MEGVLNKCCKSELLQQQVEKENSTCANHLLQENRRPGSDLEIVHMCDKRSKLHLLETLEINTSKNSSI